MTKEQRDLFPNLTKDEKPRENTKTGSRAQGRVHPWGLFPIIVVGLYARTVSAYTNRRSRVIPDSAEASADEESISEETFQMFCGPTRPQDSKQP